MSALRWSGVENVGCAGMHWIDLAWDREAWRTVVNAVMNLGLP